MKIKNIKATNFLSFGESFELKTDDKLTIIVGPNGSGKTNVFRLVEFLRMFFQKNGIMTSEDLEPYVRHGKDGFKIGVTVSLDDSEIKIINYYLIFLLIKKMEDRGTAYAEVNNKMHALLAKNGSNLLKGMSHEITFMVKTPEINGGLPELNFIFEFDGQKIYKKLYGPFRAKEGHSEARAYTLFSKLPENVAEAETYNLRPLGEILKNNPYFDDYEILIQFEQLNFNANNWEYLSRNIKDQYRGTFLGIWNEFITLAKSKGYNDNDISMSLDDFLMKLYNSSLIFLKNPRPPAGEFSINEKKEESQSANANNISELHNKQLAGISESQTASAKLNKLIVKPINGNNVTEMLFWLFDSKSMRHREIWHNFVKDVEDLTGLKPYIFIKSENIKEKDNFTEVIAGIGFEDKNGRVLPLEFAPAGAVEILTIFAAIAISNDKVLLLDEPAQNLHPPLQKKLNKKLRDWADNEKMGAQIIMITHSPYMVNPLYLDNVWRLYKNSANITKAKHLAKTLNKHKDEKWFIRQSKLLASLFSDVVVLTEGEGEEAALEVWFENINRNEKLSDEQKEKIENMEIQIFSVSGQEKFRNYGNILEKYDIKFIIFCDNKALEQEVYVNKHKKKVISTEEYNDFSHYLCDVCHNEYFEALKEFRKNQNVKCPGKNSNDEIPKGPEIILYVARKCMQKPPDVFINLIKRLLH